MLALKTQPKLFSKWSKSYSDMLMTSGDRSTASIRVQNALSREKNTLRVKKSKQSNKLLKTCFLDCLLLCSS